MDFDWLRDKRIRFTAQWLPSILGLIGTYVGFANQVGYLAATLIAAIVALFLWFVANRVIKKVSPQPSPEPPKPTETAHPVCDVGPYKVEAGENRSILLNVKQGQKVKGHLVEVDNQPFDWYIMDEKNMILLKNGEREDFISIDEGFDLPAHRVNRKIPYPGRWYLIIDLYGKRYSRKVRVDFEHIVPKFK